MTAVTGAEQQNKNVPHLRFTEFDGAWEELTLGQISSLPKYGMNAEAVKFDVPAPGSKSTGPWKVPVM